MRFEVLLIKMNIYIKYLQIVLFNRADVEKKSRIITMNVIVQFSVVSFTHYSMQIIWKTQNIANQFLVHGCKEGRSNMICH